MMAGLPAMRLAGVQRALSLPKGPPGNAPAFRAVHHAAAALQALHRKKRAGGAGALVALAPRRRRMISGCWHRCTSADSTESVPAAGTHREMVRPTDGAEPRT